MAQAITLRSVLSRLKKKSLALPPLDESPDSKQLLSALLLQVATGQSFTPESSGRITGLYARAQELSPPLVRDALPMPTAEAFTQSRDLLAAPPAVVHDLDPCILGYLYQFFCSPRRELAKQRLQTANKSLQMEETIAFTQLYTPTAVVDYLLSATVNGTRKSAGVGGPDISGTVTSGTVISGMVNLLPTLIDPSCGAGNFLVRAFDLLLPRCIAAGMDAPSAAQWLLQRTIHGCDIDRIGLWVVALAFAQRQEKLALPFHQPLQLELLVDPDGAPQLGTLRREWPPGHLLSRQYDAVVGNPPYIGRKLLDRRVKQELRLLYPDSCSDLSAAFIARGIQLLKDGGYLGYITQSSLLYLPTYSKFRRTIIEHLHILEVVELGTHVFPLQSGEKVHSMLLQLRNATAGDTASIFKDLTECKDELTQERLANPGAGSVHEINQKVFLDHRAQSINFRAPTFMIKMSAASIKLVECAEVRQGLATGNNDRFIKRRWQVPPEEIGKRWFPYVKGAGSERWFSPVETVIDWQDNGAAIKEAVAKAYPYLGGNTAWVVKNERFYFRRGLTFSLVNTSQLAVRLLPPGCIFDVAGSAVFPVSDADEDWLLAYLNSSLIAAHADILNPTINFQVGDLKELPVIPLSAESKTRMTELSRECVRLKKELYRFHPANSELPALNSKDWEPSTYQRWQQVMNDAANKLPMLEAEIDAIVLNETLSQFPLTHQEQQKLELLCQQTVARRKPVQPPFSHQSEYMQVLSSRSSSESLNGNGRWHAGNAD